MMSNNLFIYFNINLMSIDNQDLYFKSRWVDFLEAKQP